MLTTAYQGHGFASFQNSYHDIPSRIRDTGNTYILLLQLQIKVDNIALRLVEDRPPPNITSPGTPPIDLAIPTLLIVRDKSGLFSIRSTGEQFASIKF